MDFTKDSIGKCADVSISDTFSGLAEIKDIDNRKHRIVLQWISGCSCYSEALYGPDIYTEASTYAWDDVASYQNEQVLSIEEIDGKRKESLNYDAPIFAQYQSYLQHDMKVKQAESLCDFSKDSDDLGYELE